MNKVLALLAVLLTFGVSALAETPKETCRPCRRNTATKLPTN